MAVTYLQQPTVNGFVASDSPIAYVFSSNQTSQPNFSFYVEVLLNGVVISTEMVFPQRGNRAKINVEDLTTAYLKPSPRYTGLMTGQNLPLLKIRVYEKYGTVPTLHTMYQSGECKVLKASCADKDYSQNWIVDKYTPSKTWLTNMPGSTMYVHRNYPVWASILNTDDDILVTAVCYDNSGSIVTTISSSPSTGTSKVNVCLNPSDVLAAISPLSLSDLSKVVIYMNESDPLIVNYVLEECTDFHQLSWLNNIGSYDQFLFSHNEDKESVIVMLEYKKQFGEWDSSNNYVYDSLSTGDVAYSKTITPTGILYSGWLDEVYRNWLSEIYHSVDVRVYQQENASSEPTVESLVVTDTKFTFDKSRFEDILNFQVSYKKTNFKSVTK